MKFRPITLTCLLATTLLSGCLHDECTSVRTYIRFDPIYKAVSEIRSDIKSESPRSLHKPGKIYTFDNYLFINEQQEGIHVFDNSDPVNPKPIAFWNIPGNVDMAIKDQYLYVDQYVDLLTIDIQDISNPLVVCRAENVFPLFGYDPVNGFLVDYQQTSVTENVNCDDNRWGQQWFAEGDVIMIQNSFFDNSIKRFISSGLPSGVGNAGSYARFGLADQFLYTVDKSLLRSWSLSDPSCPASSDSVWLGWNAETIFPWKDRLFIGSQNGVYLFNNSNPGHPVLESVFGHATGCDPVVCDDNYAFVTIHDGTTCNGNINQLDVIGIENLANASLLKSYPMKRPFGLAVTNQFLYLCDDGLKIFDRTNPLEIKALSHTATIQAYDVIALSESHLLLVGDDGFFQFDVSNPAAPIQMSLIPVVQ
jgi:hypothetical protein